MGPKFVHGSTRTHSIFGIFGIFGIFCCSVNPSEIWRHKGQETSSFSWNNLSQHTEQNVCPHGTKRHGIVASRSSSRQIGQFSAIIFTFLIDKDYYYTVISPWQCLWYCSWNSKLFWCKLYTLAGRIPILPSFKFFLLHLNVAVKTWILLRLFINYGHSRICCADFR
jgi:hypothetical protein